ncbi:MAG TPA: GNAT family N-acetyltransferase [Acidobacteriota bacterium]|nr:GNAT family N-acetyltransferase [Acidobacteriota bacterium]
MELQFRTTPENKDVARVREIVESSGFFYDFEADVAVELVEERLEEGGSSGYHFVFAEIGGVTAAYSCFGHVEMTKSCFDLYWIATHRDFRGQGIGKKLLEETGRQVRAMGGTMLIAETSGREKYAPTRAFYDSAGYALEATIRDYYDQGDAKLIYIRRFDQG